MVTLIRMERTLAFVLDQSASGHHHLFEAALIRRAFLERTVAEWRDPEVLHGADRLLTELQQASDLPGKRAVVEASSDAVRRLFVRLYFDYLDGFMQRRGISYH